MIRDLKRDVKIMIEKGLSDAYIQSSMWAKYSYAHSIDEIVEVIEEEHKKKDDEDFAGQAFTYFCGFGW